MNRNSREFECFHHFFKVLENDGLPTQVCLQCVHYITRAYSFKQLCERSDATLRQLLGKPIQATFMELKPLLSNENHDQTFSDVINTVIENNHAVSASVADVLEPVPNNVQVNESFKSENSNTSQELKMKLEFVDPDLLGSEYLCLF